MRVLYFGTPEFAVAPLKALIEDPRYTVPHVITQPDKRSGRGKKLNPSPVKQCAELASIPVLQPKSLRKEWDSEELQAVLTEAGPYDIGVVCAFGQILPKEVLDYPTHGCINIHASLLPRWRGAAPIHRAIMAGDKETGIALMQMDEGLDTGDWYVASKVRITDETTTGELHDTLAELGSTLLVKHLVDISEGKLARQKQDDSQATYAKKITKAEAEIDWSRDASELLAHIHGLNPFPGAFTTQLTEKRLKILKVREVSEFSERSPGEPGSIYYKDDTRLEISCGNGILSLLEVQLEGKQKVSIREFLKGNKIS